MSMKIEPDAGWWMFTVALDDAPDYFEIGYAETRGAAMIEARDAYDALERRAMSDELRRIADAEGGEMFMDWPERWWADPHWRCQWGHVSTTVLRSEALGRDACLACRAPVTLTFPEDRDGPLERRLSRREIHRTPLWVALRWLLVCVLRGPARAEAYIRPQDRRRQL